MITNSNGYRCDAEVGRPGKGWRTYGRKAVVESCTAYYGTILHWCPKHAKRATQEGRSVTKELA